MLDSIDMYCVIQIEKQQVQTSTCAKIQPQSQPSWNEGYILYVEFLWFFLYFQPTSHHLYLLFYVDEIIYNVYNEVLVFIAFIRRL